MLVLTGFFIGVYLTLFLCVVQYLISSESISNQFDLAIVRSIHAFFGGCRRRLPGLETSTSTFKLDEKWFRALQNTLLVFSDQQVITSVAIMGSGFSQLSCSLSFYHWQNIVNLAWFSSVAHLTTLTTLRKYLRKNQGLRLWRLCGMIITAVMLVVGLVSTGFYNPSLTGSNLAEAIPYEFLA
jgi:hypothetical protein